MLGMLFCFSVHQSYDDGLEKKYLGIEETGYFMKKFSQLSKGK